LDLWDLWDFEELRSRNKNSLVYLIVVSFGKLTSEKS
jgi:hypothetical protein